MTAAPTKTRLTHTLTVRSTTWLSPHLVRVFFEAESLPGFSADGYTDSYVKLSFDGSAVTRTYTVRSVDPTQGRLAIDFVTHGDVGIAAPWAARATEGQWLVATGPGGAYRPDPAVEWHLFAGDLSALPAIAAALESLPENARATACLEIPDPSDALPLDTPAGADVRWLVNRDPSDTGFLARSMDALSWPALHPGGIGVFAHGERESIKAVRAVLRRRQVPRDAVSISGYWARGRTEDAFQAEKRQPIGQID